MTGTAETGRGLRDIDLLRIELGVIWQLDDRGRLPGPDDLVIGVAADGVVAAVSSKLPDVLSDRLLTLAAQGVPILPETPLTGAMPGSGLIPSSGSMPNGGPVLDAWTMADGETAENGERAGNGGTAADRERTADRQTAADRERAADGGAEWPFGSVTDDGTVPAPQTVPDVLKGCRDLLGGAGVTVTGGPSYLVEPPVRFDPPVEVLRSDEPAHASCVRPLPPETWEAEEWDTLVGGGAGAPWAMIVEDGQVAAICHTARLTPAGAEAGTWTSPAYRGRGYAAATTAVWAGLLPGIRLFYSTSADNRSSQRVARRLGLRGLGWIWHLTT